MIAPRSPSPDGSVFEIALAARVMQLNVPIRLMSMRNLNEPGSCGLPSLLIVRAAMPSPAQLTAMRSGAVDAACSTAAATAA